MVVGAMAAGRESGAGAAPGTEAAPRENTGAGLGDPAGPAPAPVLSFAAAWPSKAAVPVRSSAAAWLSKGAVPVRSFAAAWLSKAAVPAARDGAAPAAGEEPTRAAATSPADS